MKRTNRTVKVSAQSLHRAECWIHASESSIRALLQLLLALDEQQTPAWRQPRRRVRRATRHLRRAAYWARAGLTNPFKKEKRK